VYSIKVYFISINTNLPLFSLVLWLVDFRSLIYFSFRAI
jgi:hypothetical protein